MVRLIVEFGNPDANSRATMWRRKIVDAIEKAMAQVGDIDTSVPRLFAKNEYSVYMTFKKESDK